VTTQFRVLAGAAALAAGLWFLSAAPAAAPVLPKDTYKKVAEADIDQLQKHIDHIQNTPADVKRYAPTARGLAMMLAAYGESSGDDALRDGALKIAEALGKKDYKGAGDLAKKLAYKGGNKPLKPSELWTMHKYSLDEVMSPFRGGMVGGANIEKDIRSIRDGKIAVDPAAVEILAARTAVISDYAVHFPNDKAQVNKASTDEWTKLSKDALELSKKLADEAAKGKKADEKEIVKLIKALDAKCVVCHNKFRDD
jgi:hypothetical protein